MAIDPAGLKPGPAAVRTGGGLPPAGDRILVESRVRVGAMAVGQEVGARVLAEVGAGRHSILIDGRPAVLQLPQAVAAGEELRLAVLARDPVLVLAAREGSTRVSAASTPSAAAASSAEGLAAEGEGEVALSPGARGLARLIAGITAAAQPPGREPGAAAPAGTRVPSGTAAALAALARTLVPAPPSSEPDDLVGPLSRSLASALGGSGLFYESHQAQWVAGVRSLETLRAEPQGQRQPLAGIAPGAASGDAPETAGPTGPTQAPVAAPLEGRVDPELAPLVQQQLGVLESKILPWAGYAFPGVPLRIDLQEAEDDGTGSGGGEAPGGWATRLRVELPRLGAVEARLLVRGERVVLSLLTDTVDAQAEIGGARDTLARRLAEAGLQVAAFEVGSR
jgi:hypothetical protein